jgi:hypothetical protein
MSKIVKGYGKSFRKRHLMKIYIRAMSSVPGTWMHCIWVKLTTTPSLHSSYNIVQIDKQTFCNSITNKPFIVVGSRDDISFTTGESTYTLIGLGSTTIKEF